MSDSEGHVEGCEHAECIALRGLAQDAARAIMNDPTSNARLLAIMESFGWEPSIAWVNMLSAMAAAAQQAAIEEFARSQAAGLDDELKELS